MRSKTKIIVLHLKELIYTGILLVLGVGLLFLLLQTFLPKKAVPKPDYDAETSLSVSYTHLTLPTILLV